MQHRTKQKRGAVNIPFSALHNHRPEKSTSNPCFLFGDVKLHRFYFLLLDNLPGIVLMFKSQREGSRNGWMACQLLAGGGGRVSQHFK